MKKIFQKNQIAITALAIMIAVAGYLNFTEQNTSSDGTKKTAGSVETIDTMDISDGDSLIKEKAKASKDVSKSLSKNSSENVFCSVKFRYPATAIMIANAVMAI